MSRLTKRALLYSSYFLIARVTMLMYWIIIFRIFGIANISKLALFVSLPQAFTTILDFGAETHLYKKPRINSKSCYPGLLGTMSILSSLLLTIFAAYLLSLNAHDLAMMLILTILFKLYTLKLAMLSGLNKQEVLIRIAVIRAFVLIISALALIPALGIYGIIMSIMLSYVPVILTAPRSFSTSCIDIDVAKAAVKVWLNTIIDVAKLSAPYTFSASCIPTLGYYYIASNIKNNINLIASSLLGSFISSDEKSLDDEMVSLLRLLFRLTLLLILFPEIIGFLIGKDSTLFYILLSLTLIHFIVNFIIKIIITINFVNLEHTNLATVVKLELIEITAIIILIIYPCKLLLYLISLVISSITVATMIIKYQRFTSKFSPSMFCIRSDYTYIATLILLRISCLTTSFNILTIIIALFLFVLASYRDMMALYSSIKS